MLERAQRPAELIRQSDKNSFCFIQEPSDGQVIICGTVWLLYLAASIRPEGLSFRINLYPLQQYCTLFETHRKWVNS